MNAMIRLHATHTGSGRSSVPQTWLMTKTSPPGAFGTRGTGPLRATGVLLLLKLSRLHSMFPHQHSVATQSSALSMTPQMLSAILRSSDASEFSVEDLTRLQAGICQQLSGRARHASHHPAHVSRGVAPPESIGVADLNTPSSSSQVTYKPMHLDHDMKECHLCSCLLVCLPVVHGGAL